MYRLFLLVIVPQTTEFSNYLHSNYMIWVRLVIQSWLKEYGRICANVSSFVSGTWASVSIGFSVGGGSATAYTSNTKKKQPREGVLQGAYLNVECAPLRAMVKRSPWNLQRDPEIHSQGLTLLHPWRNGGEKPALLPHLPSESTGNPPTILPPPLTVGQSWHVT